MRARQRSVWIGFGILAVFVVAIATSFLDESTKLSFTYITVFDLGTRIGQVFSQFLIGQGAPIWPLFKFLAFACVIAAMALLYMLFSKFVPIISVWELKAGPREAAHPATALPQINEAGAD